MIAFPEEFTKPGSEKAVSDGWTRLSRPTCKTKPDLTPFICSLLIPGSGQIMSGRFFTGIVFLAAAVFVWSGPAGMIWPVILIHLAGAFNALGGRR